MDISQVVEMILKFLTETGLHIAVCLYIIGAIVKKSEKIPDSAIPFILLILGVGGSVAWGNEPTTPECVIQGVYATGAAIAVNQMIKQGKEFHLEMLEGEC